MNREKKALIHRHTAFIQSHTIVDHYTTEKFISHAIDRIRSAETAANRQGARMPMTTYATAN